MLFTSIVFVFFFLPLVLLTYYSTKNNVLRNTILTVFSLFFYAWGEPINVILMLVSITMNWIFALLVTNKNRKSAKIFLVFSIIANMSLLFYFKYANFTLTAFQSVLGFENSYSKIVLPIGISFFTFQAMSYVIDVYNEKGCVQKNIMNVALYISFFPQLIAGPIVKYSTIASQINSRKINCDMFYEGILRFLEGFNKKVLLSNVFAIIADKAFNYPLDNLSMPFAWLGAISYTLQIFYDFSGYSDMAIGLGKMFGFTFLENFNYPYISATITEFWNRWHISLGSWFKEYIYFPLGGSRVKKKSRLIFNLFVVWLFTGIWHGANFTFIVWGLFYFILITLEKLLGFGNKKTKIGIIYTLVMVIIGWVIFRSTTLSDAFEYLAIMFNINKSNIMTTNVSWYILIKENLIFYIIGIVLAMPNLSLLVTKIREKNSIYDILYSLFILFLFGISIVFLINGTYNPFIYFNF